MSEENLNTETGCGPVNSNLSHAELYRRYSSKVKRICLGFARDTMEMEDLCHEVFINVFRYWIGFRGESHPMAWISAIARNTCLTYARRKKSRANGAEDFHRNLETRPEFGIEDRYGARLLLEKTLSKSSHANRSILLWYYNEGWNQAEIAAKLGVSRVAVTQAIRRIRTKWVEARD